MAGSAGDTVWQSPMVLEYKYSNPGEGPQLPAIKVSLHRSIGMMPGAVSIGRVPAAVSVMPGAVNIGVVPGAVSTAVVPGSTDLDIVPR